MIQPQERALLLVTKGSNNSAGHSRANEVGRQFLEQDDFSRDGMDSLLMFAAK
jgi:hypothetical protein